LGGVPAAMITDTSLRCKRIREAFDQKRAFTAQKILSRRVVERDAFGPVHTVAGIDLSYKFIGNREIGIAVLVLLKYPTLTPFKCVYGATEVCVPYIPGLLAFREMPPLTIAMTLIKRLKLSPSVLIVDGHGKAHPRRFGIASHVGVAMDIPSIGVAKRKLVGVEEDGIVKYRGEVLARVLEKGRYKIYVSVGHRISLETAASLVMRFWRKGRLPEPTRIADRISKMIKPRITGEFGSGRNYARGDCSSYLLGA